MTTEHANADGELTDEQMDADPAGESEIVGGLDENVAGAVAYLLGPITGILFFVLEDKNTFVRFHAAQSMIVFGALIAIQVAIMIAQVVLETIPFIGWVLSFVVGLFTMLLMPIAFVLWLLLLLKAYKGERFSLPLLGGIADGLV
ncbi:DUF4870 domain-containing protein [Natrialba sp. INN-245]|uniref:DUF4870 domain-containing protein n=1 Tax=Natrialba sp. INN-245 TaxID=2690967 RepID=UPI00190F202A|nr:DUF4870 domain-containing protein [Natrialba sp. INN-245]